MNRSNIEYCDHVWNPITGCYKGCLECYASQMATRFAGNIALNKLATADYRIRKFGGMKLYVLEEQMKNPNGRKLIFPFGFEPTLHEYRLNYPSKLKNGHNILVSVLGDMFGYWVPDGWIEQVFDVCRENPIHNYLFLTQYPERYNDIELIDSDNIWYGTTITNEEDAETRIDCMVMKKSINTFVAIEPILEAFSEETIKKLCKTFNWIIIGAETGKYAEQMRPDRKRIMDIVAMADEYGVPVFMRKTVETVVGTEFMRKDFPAQLMERDISDKLKNKLYGTCFVCKEQQRKKDMVTITTNVARGNPKFTFGFMCMDCFRKACEKYNPELAEAYKKEE